MTPGTLHRYTAFADTPDGGNPAGVWVGEELPPPAEMQAIAAEVGYSETAFLVPSSGWRRTVRYFSPEAEVSFCGHATVAAGVVLGETCGDGDYRFETEVGEVPVRVGVWDGARAAALTSVEPRHRRVSAALLAEALACLGWRPEELDDAIPPALAYAGAWHLVLAVLEGHRLAGLSYDFERLKELMLREGLTTLQLVWRERDGVFHARDPFPVGGVIEDPATGAAAAALGGYLRDAGIVEAPFAMLIFQGEAVGRPSKLSVEVPPEGGIVVSGAAYRLAPEEER